VNIRDAEPADACRIAAIYNHFVANTVVTFEEAAVDAAEFERHIAETRAARLPWLVAERGGEVLGYAYASRWKGRCAYRYSAEITVYLDSSAVRQGLGSLLYAELFRQLQHQGLHVLIAGIALPNEGSVALHEKFGMRKVAHFMEVGYKLGRWVDVGYWQATLAAPPGTT
jgi:phosphinothricin acetyltransferase